MRLRAATRHIGRRARAPRGRLGLVALLASAGIAAGLSHAASPARAERELLARILDEARVERSLPEPAWSEYLTGLLQHLMAWLLEPLSRFSSSRALWPQLLAWLVLAGLLVVLALLLARWLLRNLRRREAPAPARVTACAETPQDDPHASRDRAAWRAEIDRRLAAGQVEAALEAVWWWLARSLLEQPVDPSWTSRELLAAAQRRELSPWAARLDRLLYGPARPSVPEIRAFVGRLEVALT